MDCFLETFSKDGGGVLCSFTDVVRMPFGFFEVDP